MSFKVVIPARYASTRFPGKPLAQWRGKPIVQWVYEAACRSSADTVIVATDDVRIGEALHSAREGHPPVFVLTRSEHPSGTDRVAEVAMHDAFAWTDDDIVVNVQGDEPLMPPALIDQVAALLAADPGVGIGTLCSPIESLEEFLNPNVVKVVCTPPGRALYFSRAPIPWHRDGALAELASQTHFEGAMRHIGLYAYRVASLLRLTRTSPTPLELAERLEQLRALETGMSIAVGIAIERPGPGVDTPQDLERLRRLQ